MHSLIIMSSLDTTVRASSQVGIDPRVPIEPVFGHREVNEKITCLSELSLSGIAGSGWKDALKHMYL